MRCSMMKCFVWCCNSFIFAWDGKLITKGLISMVYYNYHWAFVGDSEGFIFGY